MKEQIRNAEEDEKSEAVKAEDKESKERRREKIIEENKEMERKPREAMKMKKKRWN